MYLLFPSSGAPFASTPDTAALDITGDIDLRAVAAFVDWTPATTTRRLIAKWGTVGQLSYLLHVLTDGTIQFAWSVTGSSNFVETSSVAPAVTDGTILAIRVTMDVDIASDHVVKFYTKASSPQTALADAESNTGWTQLGSDRSAAATGVTSIFNSTEVLSVGADGDGTNGMEGSFYAAVVKNGINGTTVANPDFTAQNPGTTSFNDGTAKTWTLQGSATIAGAEGSLAISSTSSLDADGMGHGQGTLALSGTSALDIESEYVGAGTLDVAATATLEMEGHPSSGADNINLAATATLAMDGAQTGGQTQVLVPRPMLVELELFVDLEVEAAETDLYPPPEDDEPVVPPPETPSRAVWVLRVIRTAPDAAPFVDDGRFDVDGWTAAFDEPTYVTWGRLEIYLGSKDVTFYRNVPTLVKGWEKGEPFGDKTAEILFPQIHPFESLPSWLGDPENGEYARVDIYQRNPNGNKQKLWEGITAAINDSDQGLRVECMGQLYQGDLFLRRARPTEDDQPTDIGTILSYLVSPYGGDRRSWQIRPMAKKTTGVEVYSTGSWQPHLTGYVAELLSRAQTPDTQWTIRKDVGRKPVLVEKNLTDQDYSVHFGEPGVSCDLRLDMTMAPTTIFGEGTFEHCRYAGLKYPNSRPDDAPVFFGTPIPPGSTSHNDSMLLFEREMARRGWDFNENGVYDLDEEDEVRAFQSQAGISVDGIIGPQTWAAAFEVGSDGDDLSGAYYGPFYSKRFAEVWNRDPSGAKTTENADFNPRRLRVERYENFGSHITKKEAIRSAGIEVERDWPSSWFGTITLTTDTPEMSRFEIKEGRNILVRGHRGEDRLMHIANVSVDWENQSATLTVDTQARDWMTLAQMLDRDRTTTDPARRKEVHRYNRQTKQVHDQRSIWDCESDAGGIPYHAIYAGLWNVLRIPAGRLGTIVRTYFTLEHDSRFAVGIFDRPITAAQLLAVGEGEHKGDPLFYIEDESGGGYWQQFGDELLNAWGSFGQAAGYSPGRESDDDPLNGELIDDASWYFESTKPPSLWVAMYVESGPSNVNYIRGRLYPSNETT